jgi:hypothetical protein
VSHLAVEARRRQLEAYFTRALDAAISEEIRSDLAKHGIILVCGFVERSVELVLMERIRRRAHPRVLTFIRAHFKRGTNYDCEAIAQLLERFDTRWGNNFKKFMKDRDDLVQALTSAYGLRNSIAHGGEGNRGINGVKELFAAAVTVVDGIETAMRT